MGEKWSGFDKIQCIQSILLTPFHMTIMNIIQGSAVENTKKKKKCIMWIEIVAIQ